MITYYDRTKEIYNTIDTKIDAHYENKRKQAPCSKGCASCCSQFFEISDLEFSIIFEKLMHLDEKRKVYFKDKSETIMSLFKEHWSSFYKEYFSEDTIFLNNSDYYDHPERFEVMLPCIFLSDEGSCEIYNERPSTCRTTGVAFQHFINRGAVCEYIKLGLTTPLWQANLIDIRDDIESIKWIEDDNTEEFKRQYPMFFYVYDMLSNDNFDKYSKQLSTYKSLNWNTD